LSAHDVVRLARGAGAKLFVEGCSLVLEAKDQPPQQVFELLRAHKTEILELLREERRAVLRYVNDHFQSSQIGRCAHCGEVVRAGDPFVAIIVGEDWADVHASCHSVWIAKHEAAARIALGIEKADRIQAEAAIKFEGS
jgi:hypothetical protein